MNAIKQLTRFTPKTILLWLAVAVVTGVVIGRYGITGLLVVAAVAILIIVFAVPETALVASISTIIIGQLIRLPVLGSENSVIINDLLLPGLLFVWLLRKLGSGRWSLPRTSLLLPMGLLVATMIVSNLVNTSWYSSRELLSGWLYFLRWVEYAALLFVGFDVFATRQRAARYLSWLIWTGVIVSLLGFLQLRLFPDFTFMVPKGWDPHVGRLLSTWFDPNFLGGYLAFLVTISLAIALSKPFVAARWWWAAIMAMTLALVLTYSRSGYVALVAGVGIVTLLRSRALLLFGLAMFIAVVIFVPRVQERVVGIRTIDETAQLRLVSWHNAFEVIHEHPYLGVGYNLYSYTQIRYGFLDNPLEHSASGSDSSFLTIWVTTGMIGLIAFLWLYIAMLREAWRTWHDRRLSPEWRAYGLGLAAGLIALFVHAQFVNGLFYPHIMEVVWLTVAMAVMVRKEAA